MPSGEWIFVGSSAQFAHILEPIMSGLTPEDTLWEPIVIFAVSVRCSH